MPTAVMTASACSAALFGGPGAIRTRDTRFRRAVLYPLSYGAIWSRVPGAHEYRHAGPPRQIYRKMMLSHDLQRTLFRLVKAGLESLTRALTKI